MAAFSLSGCVSKIRLYFSKEIAMTMTLNATPGQTGEFVLSREQVEFFHANGYIGPLKLCSPEKMAEYRHIIETEVLPVTGPNPKSPVQCRHLDKRAVYDMVTDPAVLDPMKSLYGPDLVLWATYFFTKEPGGVEIPWHQDLNYWPIEPLINISAWIAIDRVTKENSCVQLIAGSHKSVVPHIKSVGEMAFGEMADPAYVDETKLINMELEPGEFFLFNEKTLHHSNKNVSSKRRMGLTARMTLPIVKITHDIPPLFPGHVALMACGHDTMGFNRLGTPPNQ